MVLGCCFWVLVVSLLLFVGFGLMVCLRFLYVLIAYAGGCCGFSLGFAG